MNFDFSFVASRFMFSPKPILHFAVRSNKTIMFWPLGTGRAFRVRVEAAVMSSVLMVRGQGHVKGGASGKGC